MTSSRLGLKAYVVPCTSYSSTAVGFFHLDTETPDVKYLNLYHPVLDMCLLKSGKLLVSLDLSHADPHAKEEGFPGDKLCRVLEVKDGQVWSNQSRHDIR